MDDFETWTQRARASVRRGRFADAEIAYRRALDLRPYDVKTRLDLASRCASRRS